MFKFAQWDEHTQYSLWNSFPQIRYTGRLEWTHWGTIPFECLFWEFQLLSQDKIMRDWDSLHTTCETADKCIDQTLPHLLYMNILVVFAKVCRLMNTYLSCYSFDPIRRQKQDHSDKFVLGFGSCQPSRLRLTGLVIRGVFSFSFSFSS